MQDINITFALMKVFILLKKNDLKDLYGKYTKGKEQKFGDKIEIKLSFIKIFSRDLLNNESLTSI